MKKLLLLIMVLSFAASLSAQLSLMTEKQRSQIEANRKGIDSLKTGALAIEFLNKYGLVSGTDADMSTEIQSALNDSDKAMYVKFPTGEYNISTSILVNSGQTIDFGNSKLTGTMGAGEAVIRAEAGVNEYVVRNVQITGNRSCNGIEFGEGASNSLASYKGRLEDYEIYACDTALAVFGWEHQIVNGLLKFDSVSFVGWQFNSCVIDGLNIFQSHKKDFSFEDCGGITVKNLGVQDDGNSASGWSSTINNVRNINFLSPYFESNTLRDSSWLAVGEAEEVKGLYITGITYGNNNTDGVPAIRLDSVKGGLISGSFATATYQTPVQSTINSRCEIRIIPDESTYITDNGDNMGSVYNHFPNSSFEHYFGGWDNVAVDDVTLSKETSLVKSGVSALKLTGTAVTSGASVQFDVETGIESLRGKKVAVGAWIYVPDSSFFLDSYDNREVFPDIRVRSYNGVDYLTAEPSSYQYLISGAWNYTEKILTIQSDATLLLVYVYLSRESATLTTDMWIVVDDIKIYDANIPLERIMNTTLIDAPVIYSEVHTGVLTVRDSAAPTDTDQYFNVGDKVWNDSPAVSSPMGWICTTAGAGGTAVWTSMGNL